MRIQHNIMAMNAYRNYNNNTKALSGNLEKLSSGYKINRAGDDAAGLAISEKMRAQITGLDAAQKNVKDGISLVKTAEGAMQEIQDMLNRMDYLATQSANGTYDNEVDRANLQKEVSALRSEIDRIADSANFNGIKLLDGSRDPNAAKNSAAAVAAATKNLEAAQEALELAKGEQTAVKAELDDVDNLKVYGSMTTEELISGGVLAPKTTAVTQNDGTVEANRATYTLTQLTKQNDGLGFRVNLDGVKFTISDATSSATAVTLTIGDKSVTVSQADLAAAKGGSVTAGDVIEKDVIAKAFLKKFTNNEVAITTSHAAGTGSSSVTYNVSAKDGALEFKATAAPSVAVVANLKVSLEASDKGTFHAATKAKWDTNTIGGTASTGGAVTVTIAYTGANGSTGSMTVTATIADGANSAEAARVIANAIDAAATFAASVTNTSGISITTEEGQKFEITGVTFDLSGIGGANTLTLADTAAAASATGAAEYTSGLDGYADFGTQNININSADNRDQLASTSLNLNELDLVDGMKFTLGDKTVILAIGEKSKYKGKTNLDGEVIDLTAYKEEDLLASASTTASVSAALKDAGAKIAAAANKNNGTFDVGFDNQGRITLKQLSAVSATDGKQMYTAEDVWKHIKVETKVDASEAEKAEAKNRLTAQLADKDTAVAAKEDAVKQAEEAKKTATANSEKYVDGKALKLQIGDTSDEFNQLSVEIGDMHTYAMFQAKRDSDNNVVTDKDGVVYDRAGDSIASIDISTQEGAVAAVQTIKDAINYVSSVRGDLGAVQNRLDHTANNLSVMAENIQDAESTIRDTDVADEMMKYVKNNILVQSAQAMLAQANQVPQGVLQLLG